MKTKLFELRDEGTFIPIIATLMAAPANEAEAYLLRRAGYNIYHDAHWLVLLDRLDGGHSSYCAHDTHGGGPRTFPTAHQYIQDHWPELTTGQVIDVEYILRERMEPKISERFTAAPWEESDNSAEAAGGEK